MGRFKHRFDSLAQAPNVFWKFGGGSSYLVLGSGGRPPWREEDPHGGGKMWRWDRRAYWGSVSGPTSQSLCVMGNNDSMARQFSFPFWLLTNSPVPARGRASHQACLSLRVWSWGASVLQRPPRAPTGLTPLQGRTRYRFSNTNHDQQEVGQPPL